MSDNQTASNAFSTIDSTCDRISRLFSRSNSFTSAFAAATAEMKRLRWAIQTRMKQINRNEKKGAETSGGSGSKTNDEYRAEIARLKDEIETVRDRAWAELEEEYPELHAHGFTKDRALPPDRTGRKTVNEERTGMKKRYTKEQILEAIAYWEGMLGKMNESETAKAFMKTA